MYHYERASRTPPVVAFTYDFLTDGLHVGDFTIVYRTVILAELYDLAEGCKSTFNWFFGRLDEPEFQMVCDFASYDVDYIRRIAYLVDVGEIKLPEWRVWRYTWADINS